MTAYSMPYIACDNCGATATTENLRFDNTVSQFRALLSRTGWHVIPTAGGGFKDHCPGCASGIPWADR